MARAGVVMVGAEPSFGALGRRPVQADAVLGLLGLPNATVYVARGSKVESTKFAEAFLLAPAVSWA